MNKIKSKTFDYAAAEDDECREERECYYYYINI